MRGLRNILAGLLVTLSIAGSFIGGHAHANDRLVTDLSKADIAIQADFSGENILLFGAIETDPQAQVDIAVIVQGPNQPLTIRRKSKIFGIWVNDDALDIAQVPAYYAVTSTRNLEEIADESVLAAHGVGLRHLPVQLADSEIPNDHRDFIAGLIRKKQTRKLYQETSDGVRVINNRLFRAELDLPPGVPVGTYEAQILLFRDGQVVSRQTNQLHVDIQGFEQYLYRWAHERPALYGVTGVLISIFCGWGAAAMFRRRA